MSLPFLYALVAVGAILPFVLLVALLRVRSTIHNTSSQIIWLLGMLLTFVYIGLLLMPVVSYMQGLYVQETSPTDSLSLSPLQQYFLATAFTAIIGLIFCGTISTACVLYLRSQKARIASSAK